MISVGGNFYCVPDTDPEARRGGPEPHASEIRIFEDGALIARPPGSGGQGPPPGRSRPPQGAAPRRAARCRAGRRSGRSAFYDAVGTPARGRRGPDMTETSGQYPRRAGRAEDAARAGGAGSHRAAARAGEITAIEAIDALLSEEYATRETRRIDGRSAHRQAPAGQDARELRVQLPALARPRADRGSGPARLHPSRRGRPLPRPARHRQEPSGHGARRCRRQGRPEGLSRLPGRTDRGAEPGRTRGPAGREDPLLCPRLAADRRRDRLPADHARAAPTCSSSSSTRATKRAP